MPNVIPLRSKTFRPSDLTRVIKCCEVYGHTLELSLSDEGEQYIVVFDHLGPLVHIGLLQNGGVFADGRDLGYSEHINIPAMIRWTSAKLAEGKLVGAQA